MATLYRSTRDASANSISSSQAVLQGISPDGGLFVPVDFPKLDLDLSQLPSLSYQELAYKILQPFFSDFTEEQPEMKKHYEQKRRVYYDTKLP